MMARRIRSLRLITGVVVLPPRRHAVRCQCRQIWSSPMVMALPPVKVQLTRLAFCRNATGKTGLRQFGKLARQQRMTGFMPFLMMALTVIRMAVIFRQNAMYRGYRPICIGARFRQMPYGMLPKTAWMQALGRIVIAIISCPNLAGVNFRIRCFIISPNCRARTCSRVLMVLTGVMIRPC